MKVIGFGLCHFWGSGAVKPDNGGRAEGVPRCRRRYRRWTSLHDAIASSSACVASDVFGPAAEAHVRAQHSGARARVFEGAECVFSFDFESWI